MKLMLKYMTFKRKLGFKTHMLYFPKEKYSTLSMKLTKESLTNKGFPVGHILETDSSYYVRIDLTRGGQEYEPTYRKVKGN